MRSGHSPSPRFVLQQQCAAMELCHTSRHSQRHSQSHYLLDSSLNDHVPPLFYVNHFNHLPQSHNQQHQERTRISRAFGEAANGLNAHASDLRALPIIVKLTAVMQCVCCISQAFGETANGLNAHVSDLRALPTIVKITAASRYADCQVDVTLSWYRSDGERNDERNGEGNRIVRSNLCRNRKRRKPQEEGPF